MLKLLPTLILAICLVAPASAQNSDELQDALDAARRVVAADDEANPKPSTPGYAAEMRGEQAYEHAARLYRKACDEARDALSCYRLGYLFERGRGVPQDLRQAAAWYETALAIDPSNRLARAGLAGVQPTAAPAQSQARVTVPTGNERGAANPNSLPNGALRQTRPPRGYDESMTEFLFKYQIHTGAGKNIFSPDELPVYCDLYARGSSQFADMLYLQNLNDHLQRIFQNSSQLEEARSSVRKKVTSSNAVSVRLAAMACTLIYPKIYPSDEDIYQMEKDTGIKFVEY